jgi:hypothetical protein
VIDKIKGKTKWVGSSDFLAGLTLFFASFLLFVDLFGERYLLTERDLGPYFIPPRFFWVESIKNGSFPLWNPYQFSGHPFFANPQYAMLYPFNCLFFLLPFDVTFNGIIILHFFLGGLFTYLLLRDLQVNSTGALISGLVFMLSGYLLSVHSLLTILLSSVWTPLIMMFFRRAISRPGFKNEILTAVFITLSFLGGGVEIVYGNFFILLLMGIFSPLTVSHSSVKEGVGEPLSACLLVRRGSRFGRPQRATPTRFMLGTIFYRGRSLFIISILFIFLSAVQLFPFIELFYHSIRGSGISYQEATIWSFAPKDVLLFFLPDAYGYFLDMKKYWITQCWFKTLYAGGLPFLLSGIYFIFGRGRKLFFVLMLFSICLSLGQYNPLYPFVFKYVPFFSGIRYPAKFLYLFILVLSITAGLGLQRLTELSKEGGKKKLGNVLIFFSFTFGLLLLLSLIGHGEAENFLKMRGFDFPDFNHLSVNLHHIMRCLFYLTLFFLLLRVGHEVKWRGWASILLVLFLTADLFGNMGFYGKEKTEDFFRKTKIQEIITTDKENFRTFSTEKTIAIDTPILLATTSYLDILKEKHLPSMGLPYLLHDIWGIDVIRVKRADDLYKTFIGAPSISATNLIDLYGVKYITSVTPLEEDDKFELIHANVEGLQGKWEDLIKENTIKLYKNRTPLPRAWLVRYFEVLDSKTILSMMTQKEFDPGQEVFLEEEPKWEEKTMGGHRGPPLRRANDVGEPPGVFPQKVEIIFESNNRLRLQVMAAENGLLVLSDTYYPGWKAFVNGKETRIYRADYTFKAIPLNAGVHRVEFVYDPISFKLGAGATLLGILVCIFFGWAARRTRKA